MSDFIQKLHIRNFKIFKNIEIDFNKLTILAGANSVGKSTVIQSLLLTRAAFDNRYSYDHGASLGSKPKIPINDVYLMQLGYNSRITDSNSIHFDYGFALYGIYKSQEPSNFEFKANPSENYLELIKSGVANANVTLFKTTFYYLNAERIGPRPFYETKKERYPTTGFQGEYTVELLTNGQLFDISESKNFHINTNTEGESLNTLSQQTELWMNFIIPDIQITANKIAEINRSVALFNNHTAPNVGFGISYVLPIIVSGLIAEKGCVFIVENPEAHLHPFGQNKIGQFLATVAASGVQVIVETHSEHVINGIRIASLKNIINPQDVVINFFSKSKNNAATVKKIEINSKGELSEWPEGFFDQEEQDLAEIFRLTRKK